MKRRRFWKIALMLVVPLALLAMIAFVIERNSWRPRTIVTWAAEPERFQFSPDGRTLIFVADGLYICDVASLTQRMQLDLHGGFFLENGGYLVASSGDGVEILSVWDGKSIASAPKDFEPVGVLADESTLIGWMSDESVDARQKLFRWNWRSDRPPRFSVRLSAEPNGPIRLLADKATLSDGKHFWDLATGKLRFQLETGYEARFQLINPSSFMVFREGNKVRILDYRTGQVHASMAVASSKSNNLEFKVSPDGTMLAKFNRWGAGKPQISLLDIPSGRLLRKIEVPISTSNDYRLAFSPDGRTLGVAIAGAVKLWRIK